MIPYFRVGLTVLLSSGLLTTLRAQTPTFKVNSLGEISSSTWQTLRNVDYRKNANDEYYPIFNEKIKALEGKKVELQGYFIPIEDGRKQTHFLFSSLPASSCFFCGAGGPETVAEVFCQSPVKYTPNPIRLLGTLTLNATDQEHMMYLLKEAVLVNE